MLEVYERLGPMSDVAVDARVVLSHEQRERGRMRVFSTEGEEIRLFLKRGAPLLVGERLRSQCGRCVLVEGAIESVAHATCDSWEVFSRACYHLGNRHVKVQVGERWLRILPDHVLEGMLIQLGLQLQQSRHVFIPEAGAYAPHTHRALEPTVLRDTPASDDLVISAIHDHH